MPSLARPGQTNNFVIQFERPENLTLDLHAHSPVSRWIHEDKYSPFFCPGTRIRMDSLWWNRSEEEHGESRSSAIISSSPMCEFEWVLSTCSGPVHWNILMCVFIQCTSWCEHIAKLYEAKISHRAQSQCPNPRLTDCTIDGSRRSGLSSCALYIWCALSSWLVHSKIVYSLQTGVRDTVDMVDGTSLKTESVHGISIGKSAQFVLSTFE